MIVPLIVFTTASDKAALTDAVTTQLCQMVDFISGTKQQFLPTLCHRLVLIAFHAKRFFYITFSFSVQPGDTLPQ